MAPGDRAREVGSVRGAAAPAPVPQGSRVTVRQPTRPYQTPFDQMRSSRTSAPVLGECQILLPPA
ncbi:hypothetical protein GCM10018987_20090 [Streptomyces cremeus]